MISPSEFACQPTLQSVTPDNEDIFGNKKPDVRKFNIVLMRWIERTSM
jgi:hypothetical protein